MMTKIPYILAAIALLLIAQPAFLHAQTVDGRLLMERDGADGVRARVQLRADQPVHLGTSTLLLQYDPALLAMPSSATSNAFLTDDDYTSRLPEPNIPGAYTLTSSLFGAPGTIALNLDLLAPAFGVRIDTSWTAFADLRFVQIDRSERPTLTWMGADAAEPSVLFADDNTTLLTIGTLADATLPAATSDEPLEQPGAFELSPVYPNPFAQSTTVVYTIASPGRVTLEVFDILGRRMSQLIENDQAAGTYTFEWNPAGLASGIYVMRLAHGDHHATQMVIRAR